MPMLHHFFSNYGIAFYYPNDLFYMYLISATL